MDGGGAVHGQQTLDDPAADEAVAAGDEVVPHVLCVLVDSGTRFLQLRVTLTLPDGNVYTLIGCARIRCHHDPR